MSATFRSGSNWQGSSGPMLSRNVQFDDLYPHAGQGPAGKDTLENGHHPILAIGNDAVAEGRNLDQMCGIVVTVDETLSRAVMNVASGFIAHDQIISNILTYNGGNPQTFETLLQIGMPVYVDDSDDIGAGDTLTLSPLNDAGVVNPLAGYLWYSQTEDEDVGIGGANVDAWPKTNANSLTLTAVDIILR